MSLSLKIYHRLPGWSQSLAASLRGYYLNRWRYDDQTERLVAEALERERWSAEQWNAWRERRLEEILSRAASGVPFYRESWAARQSRGDKASPALLENWPALEKNVLRERAADFVAGDCDPRKMFRDHTSGTTGTSLNIWSSPDTIKRWYALNEARCRRWYGVSRRDRWAILGGQLVSPVKRKTPPFWVWNRAMNQLYLSSYHLAPELTPFYLDALEKYRVRYILGYPSALYALARAALRRNRQTVKFEVAVANAEPLYDFQRETIAAAFDCPVRETYGMAEMVAAASECEQGSLHQWLDAGVIETDENDEFICTGLVNADMPLVRYRVGDCGRFAAERCPCGRTLPLIKKIEGRSDDVLITADGRRVGRLDPVFKNDLPVLEAQIVQKTLRKVQVKLVPAAGFDKKAARDLRERICERMGDVEVVFEKVTAIPRTTRGKFRAVVCELSNEEKNAVTR